MANPLASLKSLAASKRGKLVLGGTAATGVVVAGLVTRRRAGGDPSTDGPPYAVAPATGTSGTNTDAFPTINTPGIDIGQFEQMLAELGRLADNAEQGNASNIPGLGGGGRSSQPPGPEPFIPARTVSPSVPTALPAPRTVSPRVDTRGV